MVPEGEAGVCVRVQNRSHRRRVAVGRGSEGWDALDEELSDGEWEWPSHVPTHGPGPHNLFIHTQRDKRSYTSVSR